MISINIGDKDYTVKEAKTEEEKNKPYDFSQDEKKILIILRLLVCG